MSPRGQMFDTVAEYQRRNSESDAPQSFIRRMLGISEARTPHWSSSQPFEAKSDQNDKPGGFEAASLDVLSLKLDDALRFVHLVSAKSVQNSNVGRGEGRPPRRIRRSSACPRLPRS